MRRGKTQPVEKPLSVRTMFTMLLLALLVLLAACGSASAKAKVTPIPPTATPPPKGWNAVASPPVGSEANLTDVAALSASDAWAVGSFHRVDAVEATLVEHWDGKAWTQVASPNPSQRFNTLSAVAAVSATDAWAVGASVLGTSTNGAITGQVIERWDGKTRTIATSPALPPGSTELSGVTAIAANDVWAVGSIKASTGTQPLVEHWDGTSWKMIASAASPAVDPNSASQRELIAVTAAAPNNVWAVGSMDGKSLIEHWDGSAWQAIPGANPDDQEQILTGVSASSATDIWAVGSGLSNGQRGRGVDNGVLIEHWNGSRWTSVPFAKPANISYRFAFNTITALAANNAWVVGGYETSATKSHSFFAPVIEHWDGARWSIIPSPTLSTDRGFVGVAAAHGGPAWVVGQAELSNGAGATVIEQWNGSKWAAVASPSPGTLSNELNAVTGISAKDVWSVGSADGGTLSEHWDGVSWRVVPSANAYTSDNVLAGVAGTSSKDVWAVGSGEDLSGGPGLIIQKRLSNTGTAQSGRWFLARR